MTDRKQSYREVLGARLKTFRVDRGLSAYAVARDGAITISQVNAVEDGVKNGYCFRNLLAKSLVRSLLRFCTSLLV